MLEFLTMILNIYYTILLQCYTFVKCNNVLDHTNSVNIDLTTVFTDHTSTTFHKDKLEATHRANKN